MDELDKIKRLIDRGENEKIEFKTSFNDSLFETLVAMANTNGGEIFMGINDDKTILGIVAGKESIANWVNEIKNKTHFRIIPEIELIEIDNKKIGVVKVNEYPSKPLSYKGRYYKRFGSSNHLMTTEEVVNEYLKVRNKSWDLFLYEGKNLEDLDFNKIKAVIEKIKI